MSGDNRRIRIAISSILSGVTIAGSFPAHGQSADTQATAGLEEIIVTARKRVENLQDVPQSINVFSKESLDNLGITEFEDYATRAPSISFISIGPGTQEFVMRGVSDGSNPNAQGTSTTGMYLDELSTGYFGGIPDLHLYDINRIEVLNGPQGTLYGASAMSGAVRIVTNKPDPAALSGGFDLDGGKIEDGQANSSAEGFVNIPLIDGATALRVSGFYTGHGGFINNVLKMRQWDNGVLSDNAAWAGDDYNRDWYEGVRAALLHKFSDDWQLTLQGEYQQQTARGAWDQNPSIDGLHNVARFGPESLEFHNRLFSLTVEGDTGIGDLIYALGYWNRADRQINEYSEYVYYYALPLQGLTCETYSPDFTNCSAPTMYYDYHDHVDRWSQEVRLQSKPGGTMHWTVGGYWEMTKDKYGSIYAMPGINFAGQLAVEDFAYYYDPVLPASPLPSEWYSSSSRIDDHQIAGFGELTADVNKKLSVVVGAREFRARHSSSSDWAGYFYNPKVPTPLSSNTSSKLSFKAGINYKASAHTLYYFSFAQGFREGGSNPGFDAFPLVPKSYQPDTLDSYEIGWKMEWPAARIKWNGAAYSMDWKDMQTAIYDPQISTAGTFNANIGNARISGIETDFEINPLAGLTLSISAGYNNAKLLTDSFSSPAYLVVPGQRLPFTPYVKGAATARYEKPISGNRAGYAQFDVSHTGSMWSDLRTDNRTLQPAYDLSTLRFGINGANDRWSIEGYITNLTNKNAVLYVNTYNYDQRQTTNEPRVYGLHFKYRYDGKT